MGADIETFRIDNMVKVAVFSVALMAFGCQLALAQVPSEIGNLKTCHTEDYIRCGLVIAGCTAGCGSNYNCLVDCVINKHHEDCVDCIRSHQKAEDGIEPDRPRPKAQSGPTKAQSGPTKAQSGPCGTIDYCPNRCCSKIDPTT